MVSTLLCNFYYADMERKLFKVKDTEFLVRIIDDYLFVTPDEQSAVNFLKCMLNGKGFVIVARGMFISYYTSQAFTFTTESQLLTFSQSTNFRLFQTDRGCRRQFQS